MRAYNLYPILPLLQIPLSLHKRHSCPELYSYYYYYTQRRRVLGWIADDVSFTAYSVFTLYSWQYSLLVDITAQSQNQDILSPPDDVDDDVDDYGGEHIRLQLPNCISTVSPSPA